MINLSVTSVLSEALIAIGEAIGNFLAWLISFLPDDPFKLHEVLTVPDSVRRVLGFVNWLIPLQRCIDLVLIWFAVIASIWFIRFALKAAHVI